MQGSSVCTQPRYVAAKVKVDTHTYRYDLQGEGPITQEGG